MDGDPRCPVHKLNQIDVALKVLALLDSNGRWRMEKLWELFLENEVKRILAL